MMKFKKIIFYTTQEKVLFYLLMKELFKRENKLKKKKKDFKNLKNKINKHF